MDTAVWPIGLYFILVVILIVGMLGLSALLGERHNERATGAPYESGVVSEGSARVRFPVRFYLIAMFFVVFDLEGVFIFAWAVSAKEVGWAGYWEILIFVGILVAALAYLWRLGALDFGAVRRPAKRSLIPPGR
ncbi:MAG: NADH-quinone oxidoreductase subunit A [Acidobacteriota bacterium]|nr:NADH-quinone oxidoreductase subunit A [Acidobacteriota bacterium]